MQTSGVVLTLSASEVAVWSAATALFGGVQVLAAVGWLRRKRPRPSLFVVRSSCTDRPSIIERKRVEYCFQRVAETRQTATGYEQRGERKCDAIGGRKYGSGVNGAVCGFTRQSVRPKKEAKDV